MNSTSVVLTLDENFQTSTAEWQRYLESLLHPMIQQLPTGPKIPPLICLLDGRESDQQLEVSLRSLRVARKRLRSNVVFRVFGTAALDNSERSELQCFPTIEAAISDVADEALIGFLKSGDFVIPEFFDVLIHYLDREMILFDMFSSEGKNVLPIFLPGINLHHLRAVDYLRSRYFVVARLVKCAPKPATSAYDICKHAFERLNSSGGRIVHLPCPLVGVRGEAERISAERHVLWRNQLSGSPPNGRVSVITCTRNRPFLLPHLISTVLRQSPEQISDVIVVTNETNNPFALSALDEARTLDSRVQVIRFDQAFNFSKQCNMGAKCASGEFLLFLNDDVVPLANRWLEELLLPFHDPKVAITGARLLYPDERIQHAGAYLGYNGVGGHTLRFATLPDADYLFMASAPRQVSWVTGAALMTRRHVFRELNGFDETLATYLQDLDFCMRAGSSGCDIVFTPYSTLIHMESLTLKLRLADDAIQVARQAEFELFSQRWSGRVDQDPFHNPNFCLSDETLHRLTGNARSG